MTSGRLRPGCGRLAIGTAHGRQRNADGQAAEVHALTGGRLARTCGRVACRDRRDGLPSVRRTVDGVTACHRDGARLRHRQRNADGQAAEVHALTGGRLARDRRNGLPVACLSRRRTGRHRSAQADGVTACAIETAHRPHRTAQERAARTERPTDGRTARTRHRPRRAHRRQRRERHRPQRFTRLLVDGLPGRADGLRDR